MLQLEYNLCYFFYKERSDGKRGSVMKRYLWLLVLFVGLQAKSKKISSTSQFYEALEPRVQNQLKLVTVLFYDKNEAKVPKDMRKQDMSKEERDQIKKHRNVVKKAIDRQKRSFENAGKAFKEVDFLLVDVSDKDNSSLTQSYAINYYPTILLFKEGKPFVVNNKKVSLTGDFSQGIIFNEPDIVKFVQKYFSKDIDMIIQAKAKADYELAKLRAAAPKYYSAGPYWGWGWGGWGYGGWGGWGGWGYGRGWGWGGCC